MNALLQTRSANERAKRFALDAADGLLDYGRRAALTAGRLLSELEDASAPAADREELRKLLTDTFGYIQGQINRALDAEGLADDRHQIDLTVLGIEPPPSFGDIRRLKGLPPIGSKAQP